MTRHKLLTAAACGILLSLTQTAAFAQYYSNPYGGGYRGANTYQLSPYLNLQQNNATLAPAINYFNGTVAEQERRSYQDYSNSRLNNIELRDRQIDRARDPEIEDVLPGVPTAGFPYGRRSYRDYFREDRPGGGSLGRRLPVAGSAGSGASSYYRR
jgi:hypothetical protein